MSVRACQLRPCGSIVTSMATKTVVESDLSGEPGASTVPLALGQESLEIDLTHEEYQQLRQTLATYLEKARPRDTSKEDQPQGSARFVPETTQAQREFIRQWAKDNGYQVADRGQIPKKIFFAYKKAHGGVLPEVTEEDLV